MRVRELSELAGEFDLGKALESRLMVPMSDVELMRRLLTALLHIKHIEHDPVGGGVGG